MWKVVITGLYRPFTFLFPSYVEALEEIRIWEGTDLLVTLEWIDPLPH